MDLVAYLLGFASGVAALAGIAHAATRRRRRPPLRSTLPVTHPDLAAHRAGLARARRQAHP